MRSIRHGGVPEIISEKLSAFVPPGLLAWEEEEDPSESPPGRPDVDDEDCDIEAEKLALIQEEKPESDVEEKGRKQSDGSAGRDDQEA